MIYFEIGPSTIQTAGGTPILVGVASYIWRNCGPGVNNGLGTYKTDAANYVDINKYMEWIKKTMNEFVIFKMSCQNIYYMCS